MAARKRSAVQRDARSDVPQFGLCLSELAACRGPVHRQDRRATIIRASPTRPSTCSRTAWRCSKAPKRRAAFATGMAAVTNAVMSQVRAGDHIVAARALFGGCRYRGRGFHAALGRALDAGRWPRSGKFRRAPCSPTPSVVFIETPTNPTLELVDIAAVAEIAHAHGAKLIVDNVFATAALPEAAASWAPISSPIRPPSISTARAGCWAASCSAARS